MVWNTAAVGCTLVLGLAVVRVLVNGTSSAYACYPALSEGSGTRIRRVPDNGFAVCMAGRV